MTHTCDGCGEQATRWSFAADGPWAGKLICRECRKQGIGLKHLSWAVTFRYKVAQVLPPNDKMTVPVVRLLMAVDDVRRAQLQLVEARERLDDLPAPERYLAIGDLLYAFRLLFSHLHEAGIALRALDTAAKKRVDAALKGNREAIAALRAVRKFFNAANYNESLVARVRNVIGFHYDNAGVNELVENEFSDNALLEATSSEVGGLGRMADPLVRAVMNTLVGGDFVANEEDSVEVEKALDVGGHLITFVDYLFDALMRRHLDAIVEQHQALLKIPPLVRRAREAVEAARRRLKAEEEAAG